MSRQESNIVGSISPADSRILGVPGACKGKRGILVDLDMALRTDERHLGFQVSPSIHSLHYSRLRNFL